MMRHLVPALLVLLALVGPAAAEDAFGLNSQNQFFRFNTTNPGAAAGLTTVTGLNAGESLVALDVRPADTALVGVGYNTTTGIGTTYLIDKLTGSATQLITGIGFGTGVTAIEADFNPVPGALRIVTNAPGGASSDNNFRITAGGGGTLNVDGDLNPGTPDVRAGAYSNNRPGGSGGVTTLYVIDAASNQLFTQGSLNFPVGGGTSPNIGTLLNAQALVGISGANVVGFDISGATANAFLATSSELFNFDVNTATATSLGNFTGVGSVIDISAAAVPEPSTWFALAVGGFFGGLVFRHRLAAKSGKSMKHSIARAAK